MRHLLLVLALVLAVPSFGTYGNGGNQGDLVAADEAMYADVALDLSHGNAAAHLDEVVELCNAYSNSRIVTLRVNHHNQGNLVRIVNANRRVAARRNVRVVFVNNRQRVVAHRNQVRVNVRARNRRVFGGIFNAGFQRRDRTRAQQVISVRVRG